MGGMSEEREVSLRSGKAVARALTEANYEVETLDFNQDNLVEIKTINPDVVFITLHGKNGEDGSVQGYLDILGIPYTGSGLTASAVGMNKILTKKMLCFDNIPTADFIIIEHNNFLNESESIVNGIVDNLGLPVVVKAPNQGSSIGTYIVRNKNEISKAIKDAFTYDHEVLVEKFIDGIEVTASLIGNDNPIVLPLIEITSTNEFYDYESKYTPGMCEHIIPARIADEMIQEINDLSVKVYKLLGCKGFARVDFIIDYNNDPYVLEINTIPGMTDMSLVPDAARAIGISYVELCDKVVKLALEQ